MFVRAGRNPPRPVHTRAEKVYEVQGEAMTCRMWGCERPVSDAVDGKFCSTECRVTREKREYDAKEAMLDEKREQEEF